MAVFRKFVLQKMCLFIKLAPIFDSANLRVFCLSVPIGVALNYFDTKRISGQLRTNLLISSQTFRLQIIDVNYPRNIFISIFGDY